MDIIIQGFSSYCAEYFGEEEHCMIRNLIEYCRNKEKVWYMHRPILKHVTKKGIAPLFWLHDVYNKEENMEHGSSHVATAWPKYQLIRESVKTFGSSIYRFMCRFNCVALKDTFAL